MDKSQQQTVAGEIVEIDETYTRDAPVGVPVLAGILTAAGLARAAGLVLLLALRRAGGTGGGRRTFKQLRKGPEVPVTSVWVREPDGAVVEVEVHGYVCDQALLVSDRVSAQVEPQKRAGLPPRARRIDNHTSGRTVAPYPPTRLTHLGTGLLLQAVLGAVLAVLLVACVLGAFR